jgi:membrane protease subunit HflC
MTRARLIGIGLSVLVGLYIILNCFYTVQETQQALLVQFGEVKSVARDPGLYMKLPEPIQTVIYIEDRLLPLQTPELEIADAEQRRFLIDAVARWRVTNPVLFYKTVQGNITIALPRLDGFLQGSMRKIIGQRPFADVLSTKRGAIMLAMKEDFAQAAKVFGVELVDVRIRRADQPEDITNGTFNRMKSDRQREATDLRARGQEEARKIRAETEKKAVVIRAEARRQSEILRGKGDAERIRIFAEANNQDPQFYAFYRSMRAYEEALGDKETTFVLSPDSEFLRFFGTGKTER